MTATVHPLHPARAPSLEPMVQLVAGDLNQVNAVILDRMQSEVPLIPELAGHLIAGGGKRMRPMLTLACARLLDYPGTRHHKLAAAVEFIHTATLLHDDVVDDSPMRRGRRTANTAFGNAAAVLVGDFLYSRAFQMMVGVGSMRVMQVLADATNTIAEGEVLQLMNCHDPDVDEENYLDVIRRKTAKLFEASARLGAVLGGSPQPVEAALAGYGVHLGTAFQLVDDVLDYSGDAEAIGKSLGDDLAEGKPTLPLIRAMAAGSAGQREIVRRAIIDGGREDFPAVIAAVRETGALEYARDAAKREAERAREAIALLPDSTPKQSLLELASFSVTRDH